MDAGLAGGTFLFMPRAGDDDDDDEDDILSDDEGGEALSLPKEMDIDDDEDFDDSATPSAKRRTAAKDGDPTVSSSTLTAA